MLSLDEGKKAVGLARESIESELNKTEVQIEAPKSFEEKRGVFVTINKGENLRGCIGRPYPNQSLKEGILGAAKDAAFNDPRFPSLTKEEIDEVKIEVTILTKPDKIEGDPKKRPEKIEIGKHGLIAESGYKKGLLLPQVPVDNDWDEIDFLSQTAMKAGLSPDAWVDEEVGYYKFEGQIFAEETPNGEILERKIDESN